MTREEAMEQLRIGPGINEDVSEEYNNAVDMALKALEQELCEEAVSRKAVLNEKYLIELEDGQSFYCINPEDVEALPPVIPTACIAKVTFSEEDLQKIVDEKVKELVLTQRWIPVSERLPDKGGQYLVSLHSSTHDAVDVINYARNLYLASKYDFPDEKRPGWFVYDSEYGRCERKDVIAWQPLPEPYRESEG